MKSGVTLIELLVVIAFISIIAASSAPFLGRFVIQNYQDSTVDRVVSTLKKAQSYSMDGKNNATWGACVTGSNLRLFTGTCGAPSFNEDFSFPSSVSITGFSTITFSKTRGEPSATLSIVVATSVGSKTITLNSAGEVDIN